MCAKYMFCRLCEHMIKNNDIYIFAHLSAILKLWKLDNQPVERCESVNKWVFENIIKISLHSRDIGQYDYIIIVLWLWHVIDLKTSSPPLKVL